MDFQLQTPIIFTLALGYNQFGQFFCHCPKRWLTSWLQENHILLRMCSPARWILSFIVAEIFVLAAMAYDYVALCSLLYRAVVSPGICLLLMATYLHLQSDHSTDGLLLCVFRVILLVQCDQPFFTVIMSLS